MSAISPGDHNLKLTRTLDYNVCRVERIALLFCLVMQHAMQFEKTCFKSWKNCIVSRNWPDLEKRIKINNKKKNPKNFSAANLLKKLLIQNQALMSDTSSPITCLGSTNAFLKTQSPDFWLFPPVSY